MDSVELQVDWSIDFWPCLVFSGLGTMTNAVNVVVLWSLGFHESSTISLMVIAITDAVKCAAAFLYRGYGFCGMVDTVLGVNWMRVAYLVSTYVQSFAVPVSNVVTMYLTIERCLCLCLPLRVKSLITPKVTFVVLTLLIAAVLAFLSPMLTMYYITWVDDHYFNHSIAIYSPTDVFIRDPYIVVYLDAAYVSWSVTPFVTVAVCTAIFIIKLKHHWRFRTQYLKAEHYENRCHQNVYNKARISCNAESPVQRRSIVLHKMSTRETSHCAGEMISKASKNVTCDTEAQRLTSKSPQRPASKVSTKEVRMVKMLLLIVLVYFISILPRLTISLARTIEPEFNVNMEYNDLFLMSNAISFLIDLLVANSHVFIYLTMSTQYRERFCLILAVGRRN